MQRLTDTRSLVRAMLHAIRWFGRVAGTSNEHSFTPLGNAHRYKLRRERYAHLVRQSPG